MSVASTGRFGSSRVRGLAGPVLESLEERLFLDGTAPVFATALEGNYILTSEGALTIGVDGFDADGDGLTITAVSDNPGITSFIPTGNRYALLHFTDSGGVAIGDILIQLFDGRSPTATERFVTLATNHVNGDGTLDPGGVPFYTDVVVHRVIDDFMIQTGDAENGNGTGGSPLGTYPDAFDPNLSFAWRGALGSANSGPDTNDSQFFITDVETPWLNQAHMIFGQVISGWDVYEQIITLPTDANDRPLDPPLLAGVDILASSDQDGTISFQAADGFAGQAQVTVTLDDGNGNTVEQVITIDCLGDRPEIGTDNVTVAPGGTLAFDGDIVDDGGEDMLYTITTPQAGATVAIDPVTAEITVTSPADFVGLFGVTVTAVEDVDYALTPASHTFYVFSQNAGDPEMLDHLDAGGSVLDVFAVDEVLYVAAGEAGLKVYDASGRDPVLLGTYDTEGSARQVEVDGRTAFVADGSGGLLSLDVSDPTDITLRDSVQGGGDAIAFSIDRRFAYVAEYDGGVSSYNISNPDNLKALDTITELVPGVDISRAVGIVAYDDYIYVSDFDRGVHIIDATNPSNMRFVNHRAMNGAAGAVTAVGRQADLLLVTSADGVQILDLSVPIFPTAVDNVEVSVASPWMISVVNRFSVVVGGNGGFSILDVIDPANAVEEYTFTAPDWGGIALAVNTTLLLPMSDDGLLFMDGSEYVNRTYFEGDATFRDDAGNRVRIDTTGVGVRVHTTDTGDGSITKLEVFPTGQGAAEVKISANGGSDIHDIIVNGSLVSFDAGDIDLAGDMTVTGSVNELVLGNVADDHTIAIEQWTAGQPGVSITLGDVTDLSIDSAMPIEELTVAVWDDWSGDVDVIETPWLGDLHCAGDFDAALFLTGHEDAPLTLGRARIGGQVGGDWNIEGNGGKICLGSTAADWIGAFTGDVDSLVARNDFSGQLTVNAMGKMGVGGDMVDATLNLLQQVDGADRRVVALGRLNVRGRMIRTEVHSAGHVKKLSAAGLEDTTVFAGVADGVTDLPDAADDFDAEATIASLKIRKSNQPFSVVNSNVAAWMLGKINYGTVQTDNSANGGEDFGLAGHDLQSFRRTTDAGKYRWPNSDEPEGPAADGDFVVRLV